jgi:phospholipid/cholesterol/gamma-HCH transport system substrate-binding protein
VTIHAVKKFSLRRAWQRLRTVPGLGRNVTALAVVIVLALLAGGIILSNEDVHWPWQAPQFSFRADFQDAVGVDPGKAQQVLIAGVPVGTITGSTPTAAGTSLVSLSIDAGHPIYTNARVVLQPKNPLNEMYIELNPGGPPGKPLPQNGIIQGSETQSPVTSSDVFDHLDARARAALTDLLNESGVALADAPDQLPQGLQATDQMLGNLRPVVQALQARRVKIRQLVTAISQISTAVGGNNTRLANLLDSTEQTLATLSNRNGDMAQTLSELPGFTGDLHDAMTSSTALTNQLNPLLDHLKAASAGLPSTLSAVSQTVNQLGMTVQKAAPVVQKAGPVVADLRPIATDLNGSLSNLQPLAQTLNYATSRLVPFMDGLQAFVYNTASLFSGRTSTGGAGRAQFELVVTQPLGDTGCTPLPGQPCPTGGGK